MTKYSSVDEYIKAQEKEVADRLEIIRQVFHNVLPKTEESIRYDMPAFTVGKDHLYIGAYKDHIGMYPMYGIPELDDKLLKYRAKGTKDSLHFKHTEDIPVDLIKEIILAKENKES